MHDDPTRIMGQPEQPGRQPHGNMRLLVAGLVAVIVGLVVAIVVIASGSGGDSASTRSAVFTEVEPTESSTAESTGETPTESTATEPTTTGSTTEPTTTAPPTATEEENGSGGIPAE
jgi:hypothetical protein